MDLQSYLDILKRRALVVILVASITVIVALTTGYFVPPVYEAKATARVLMDVGVLGFDVRWDYAERLLNTYGRILKSGPILEEVINRVSSEESPISLASLRSQVTVDVIPDTELLTISVQNEDPVMAMNLANALTVILVEYAQEVYTGNTKSARQIIEDQLAGMEIELQTGRDELEALVAEDPTNSAIETLQSEIQSKEASYNRLLERYELTRLNESLRANSVTIISPATLPGAPSNALGLADIGISLLVGLFGGVALALVMENLDTRIHSPQQLERLTHSPVLNTIPRGPLVEADQKEQAYGNYGVGQVAEAYRLLSANLQVIKQEEEPLRTILITSAMPKEGKSTVASNLALTLAERGQTVFLVEADMRRPSLEEKFKTETNEGLSDLLQDSKVLDEYKLSQVLNITDQPNLFFISAGETVANPTALLASLRMHELLAYLGAQGQTTIVDAPPIIGMADVSVLAPQVDGVILVVKQGVTRREQLQDALKQLHASKARVLGITFLK